MLYLGKLCTISNLCKTVSLLTGYTSHFSSSLSTCVTNIRVDRGGSMHVPLGFVVPEKYQVLGRNSGQFPGEGRFRAEELHNGSGFP